MLGMARNGYPGCTDYRGQGCGDGLSESPEYQAGDPVEGYRCVQAELWAYVDGQPISDYGAVVLGLVHKFRIFPPTFRAINDPPAMTGFAHVRCAAGRVHVCGAHPSANAGGYARQKTSPAFRAVIKHHSSFPLLRAARR